MNQITIFTYENTSVRTTAAEDGTPLFCGKDVATTLGYTNTQDALARHCKGFPKRDPLRLQVEHNKPASSPKVTSTD